MSAGDLRRAHYHDNDATPIAGGWACYCDCPENPDRPADWSEVRSSWLYRYLKRERPMMVPAYQAGQPVGEIRAGWSWLGQQYVPVWRVMIDGCQVGVWTKQRWAKRDLRQQLRAARVRELAP